MPAMTIFFPSHSLIALGPKGLGQVKKHALKLLRRRSEIDAEPGFHLLVQIAGNLVVFPVIALAALILILIVTALIKTLLRK